MNDESQGVVRVGVKRWDRDRPAEPGERANSMIGPMWVEVDGVRIPGDVLLQASASFESGDEAGSPGFGLTTFKVITSSYQTVDHETGEPVQ